MRHLWPILIVLSLKAHAYDLSYYPAQQRYQLADGRLRGGELKDSLLTMISQGHTALAYSTAKKFIFAELHLERDHGEYMVQDVYCRKKFGSDERANVGPGKVPNHTIVNLEHTWPQSKFTSSYSKKIQKGDLHHLYPTDSVANSTRSAHEFGEADSGDSVSDCPASKITRQGRQAVFEPPHEHKGNVARAMFYFAIRYKMTISSSQERVLRSWHEIDPVDYDEEQRNEDIYLIQGNRNPFIDFPHLVDSIRDF